MNRSKSYLLAFVLGLLTVIVCLAVGDGLFGVVGTLGDCIYDESGELIEYTVHIQQEEVSLRTQNSSIIRRHLLTKFRTLSLLDISSVSTTCD